MPDSKLSKKFISYLLICISILMLLSVAKLVQALSPKEVDSIASQTTVLIAKGLEKGDIKARQEWDPGSGVIIARNGNTYYAATNTHVVKQQIKDKLWGVRTADGTVHVVKDVIPPILRFGNYSSSHEPVKGFDLALLQFESNKDYLVAPLGQVKKIKPHDPVFISGWPQPENRESFRKRVLRKGVVVKIASNPDHDGGYDILYSNRTDPGMSGGPVFNQDGELIGIHATGKRRGDLYCVDLKLNMNNSCGIKAQHLVNLAQIQGLNLSYASSPVSSREIARGQELKSKADFILDIYGLFTELNKIKERVNDLEQRIERLLQ